MIVVTLVDEDGNSDAGKCDDDHDDGKGDNGLRLWDHEYGEVSEVTIDKTVDGNGSCDKMVTILQTAFWIAFSSVENV